MESYFLFCYIILGTSLALLIFGAIDIIRTEIKEQKQKQKERDNRRRFERMCGQVDSWR